MLGRSRCRLERDINVVYQFALSVFKTGTLPPLHPVDSHIGRSSIRSDNSWKCRYCFDGSAVHAGSSDCLKARRALALRSNVVLATGPSRVRRPLVVIIPTSSVSVA